MSKKEFIRTLCIFCKSKPTLSLLGLTDYWHCPDCGIAWVKKIPKVEYGDMYYKGKSTLASRVFAPIGKTFYSLRSTYAGNGGKKVWIDVGAGDGGFLSTVAAKKKIGVEVSSSGRKIMQQNGLDTLTDRQFLKSKGLNADIISFWHVLEHVEKPWEYLESAKRNLKKNGKIIIGIPNIDSFEFKYAKKYWFHLQPQFHLWHFTPKSVKKLLDITGFTVNKIDHWSIEHHPTGVLQSFINKSSGSSENVLHKLIKRGTGKSHLAPKDIFWVGFWTSIGSPIIFSFWLGGSIFRKAGTIVVVASKSAYKFSSPKIK
ncbi:MAG: hypothetical protein A2687_01725 [Candidatus Levybacteria bacterium RIFCSPHIGHO2_01_FULL_38_26]|nr:MAG: hypothetical protein A2687_01725 [Candidatus Levybacteria bacterium RIFCSPHIGHO2_01_FULL_38_26]